MELLPKFLTVVDQALHMLECLALPLEIPQAHSELTNASQMKIYYGLGK